VIRAKWHISNWKHLVTVGEYLLCLQALDR